MSLPLSISEIPKKLPFEKYSLAGKKEEQYQKKLYQNISKELLAEQTEIDEKSKSPEKSKFPELRVRRKIALSVDFEHQDAIFFALDAAVQMAGFEWENSFFLRRDLHGRLQLPSNTTLIRCGIVEHRFISTFPLMEIITKQKFETNAMALGSVKDSVEKRVKLKNAFKTKIDNAKGIRFRFVYRNLHLKDYFYPLSRKEFSFTFTPTAGNPLESSVQVEANFRLSAVWLRPLVERWLRNRVQMMVNMLKKVRLQSPPAVVTPFKKGKQQPLLHSGDAWLDLLACFFEKGRKKEKTWDTKQLHAEIRAVLSQWARQTGSLREQAAMEKLAMLSALLTPGENQGNFRNPYFLHDAVFSQLSPLQLGVFFHFQVSLEDFFSQMIAHSVEAVRKEENKKKIKEIESPIFTIYFGLMCVCGKLREITENVFCFINPAQCQHCFYNKQIENADDIFMWFELKETKDRQKISSLFRKQEMFKNIENSSLQKKSLVQSNRINKSKTRFKQQQGVSKASEDNFFLHTTFTHLYCSGAFNSFSLQNQFVEKFKQWKLMLHHKKIAYQSEPSLKLALSVVVLKTPDDNTQGFWRDSLLQTRLEQLAAQFGGRLHDWDSFRGAIFIFPAERFANAFILHFYAKKNRSLLWDLSGTGVLKKVFLLFSVKAMVKWHLQKFHFFCDDLDAILVNSRLMQFLKNKIEKNEEWFCISKAMLDSKDSETITTRFAAGFRRLERVPGLTNFFFSNFEKS